MKKIALVLIVLLAFNACSKTVNAWNGATPKEYLEVYGKEDLPLKLKEKNVDYRCVDMVYSSEGHTKKCYVSKSSAEKVEGWSSRFYKTSKAFLFDTGENVVILGVIVLCSMGGDCRNLDISKMKE